MTHKEQPNKLTLVKAFTKSLACPLDKPASSKYSIQEFLCPPKTLSACSTFFVSAYIFLAFVTSYPGLSDARGFRMRLQA